jgi:hypothetical protein
MKNVSPENHAERSELHGQGYQGHANSAVKQRISRT